MHWQRNSQAASLIVKILERCPDVKVLAASQLRLQVVEKRADDWEKPIFIYGLAKPDPKNLPPLKKMKEIAAIQLFLNRANAVRKSGLELKESNALAIATICESLDGLPQAIEIAAAQSDVRAPGEILDDLQGQLGTEILDRVFYRVITG